ncbi:MAG: D-glycero-beta-D-manno-heptose 1-phosphate adenylyltransferase, partial [Alphaproteobacteria bacterium]|nr:D-glycero-beta-D-manno-heptose 1-phosphate adenylyltransferase [Alphaproteobacteria bacterium]
AIAALAAALAAGAEPGQAARLANAAAGIKVGKRGLAVVTREEIAAELAGRTDGGKFLDRPALLARVQEWRRRGLKVGFTNGCFDLIHPGHVALLAAARAACDRLVVALNTDASVKRLKGPNRPVQDERSRATVMASLAAVDAVTLFGEDTPQALIEAIAPEMLIKGADYSRDKVVGGDFVEAHGGRVVLVPIEQGHSTTATIGRIGR